MATPRLPAANIITDQFPYPFNALEAFIRSLIVALFGPGASTVVWRPGAVSSGNVFGTWAEIVAQVATMNGAITIGIDTDTAPATIPPGAYDLRPVGVSGPVTFVNASKVPPFAQPFVTLGPGAVTIAGLTGLDDVSIDNQSTVPVQAITTNGTFSMKGRSTVFQEPGAAAFWAITGGDYAILVTDFGSITTPGGGVSAMTVAAPGSLLLHVQDSSGVDTNMLVSPAAITTVVVAPASQYLAQAGAPTIIPAKMTQKGSSAIVVGTGKTAAIPVFMSASARIVVTVKDPVGDALTIKYGALAADRVNGALGSFKISALAAAGGGAVNGVDTSTIDWEVVI